MNIFGANKENESQKTIKFYWIINLLFILGIVIIDFQIEFKLNIWTGIAYSVSLLGLIIVLNKKKDSSIRLIKKHLIITSINSFCLSQKLFMLNAYASNYYLIFLLITGGTYILIIILSSLFIFSKEDKRESKSIIFHVIGGIIAIVICLSAEYISSVYFNQSITIPLSIVLAMMSCAFGYTAVELFKKDRNNEKYLGKE